MDALKNRFESAASKLVSLEHSPKYQNARHVKCSELTKVKVSKSNG
jgi:hypothetical protein